MFSFASILALLESAPALIDDADSVVASVKNLLASPDVQAFEAQIAKLFTSVTTPGSAAIIEPIASTNARVPRSAT